MRSIALVGKNVYIIAINSILFDRPYTLWFYSEKPPYIRIKKINDFTQNDRGENNDTAKSWQIQIYFLKT